MNRRYFLKKSAQATAAVALTPASIVFANSDCPPEKEDSRRLAKRIALDLYQNFDKNAPILNTLDERTLLAVSRHVASIGDDHINKAVTLLERNYARNKITGVYQQQEKIFKNISDSVRDKVMGILSDDSKGIVPASIKLRTSPNEMKDTILNAISEASHCTPNLKPDPKLPARTII